MKYQLSLSEQQVLQSEFLHFDKGSCLFGAYCEEYLPIYYANDEMAAMLGYSNVDELIASIDGKVINTIYPEDIPVVWKDLGRERPDGMLFKSTHRIKRKDGSSFWAIYRGKIVRTEDDRQVLLCLCTDVTTFIAQKEALEQERIISTAILKSVPGGYHRCIDDGKFTLSFVSEHFLEILGWTMDELREKFDNSFLNLLHPDDRQLVVDFAARIASSPNGLKNQDQIYRLQGKYGYRWVTDTAMKMVIGGKTFYQGFISDITAFIEEREQRERRLARLEQSQQENEAIAALGRLYHALFHIDLENDTYSEIFCRPEVQHYYNYNEPSAAKMLEQVCRQIVDKKNTAHMRRFFDLKTLAQRLKKREYVETECVTKNGDWHRARLIAKRRDAQGNVTHALYVTLIINDEKQYQEHLVAQAEHANYENQSKTAFISQVAHDIRTPMNSIFGFLEIAEANINDPEKLRYSLGKIRIASEFLKDLVSDVMDISRMESNRLTLQPAALDLTKMLDEFIVSVRNAKSSKQQIFRTNTRSILHDRIVVDALRLKQIYANVLSNAVKYTPDGGIIDFTVYQEPSQIPGCVRLISIVTDTGIGMSEEFMSKMFTKFERGTDTRINAVSGYGLGLTIVKYLVDEMGGTIAVKSQPGEGSTFTITLEVPYLEESCAVEISEPAVDYAAACAGMHLLVAEDNELNQEVITELLAMNGMTCECTENGKICLERFRSEPANTYDAILMDIQMPVMNGIDATKQIRTLLHPRAKNIPIIAMTANAMKEDVQNCLSAGMDLHLSKPVDITQMIKALAQSRQIR